MRPTEYYFRKYCTVVNRLRARILTFLSFLRRLVFFCNGIQLSEGLDNDPIVIPTNDRLTALIGVLPLQLIAYELALLKGINPDTPRNLAKVISSTLKNSTTKIEDPREYFHEEREARDVPLVSVSSVVSRVYH